jgi:hypothetical protein
MLFFLSVLCHVYVILCLCYVLFELFHVYVIICLCYVLSKLFHVYVIICLCYVLSKLCHVYVIICLCYVLSKFCHVYGIQCLCYVMFQTLAGRPQNGRQRGVHVLNLMKGLSPNLHDNLVELWDTVIPKLVQYLEGK